MDVTPWNVVQTFMGPRHIRTGDSGTLAPALRSQFLFSFNILTRFGRIAVKLGEDVQSRCWEELYWSELFQGLSYVAVPLYIKYSFCSTQLQDPNLLYLWDRLIHEKHPEIFSLLNNTRGMYIKRLIWFSARIEQSCPVPRRSTCFLWQKRPQVQHFTV